MFAVFNYCIIIMQFFWKSIIQGSVYVHQFQEISTLYYYCVIAVVADYPLSLSISYPLYPLYLFVSLCTSLELALVSVTHNAMTP